MSQLDKQAPVSNGLLIQTVGLTLGYGAHTVLEQVNIEVKAGEFWFLLGQNGTGKTTLLKALLGLIEPLDGEIYMSESVAQRDRLGFVPQRCDFNNSLPTTVGEFVSLGLVGIRVGRKERSSRLEWSLEKVGLMGMARMDYWALSEGQRQRALVARALARHPKLLIMDEPTIGLDPVAESALLEYLGALNRDNDVTILCVSHDLTTAAQYSSHVALFHHGRVESGRVQEVLNPLQLQRAYGVELDIGWEAHEKVPKEFSLLSRAGDVP